MRHQNGKGPDHCGSGVEARELERPGQRLEVLATAEISTRQDPAVHAEIICCIALQFGADVETIRKALCRDARGNANGPLGVALDILAERAK